MAEHNIRPPEGPKPSNLAQANTNRLKNRLILGVNKLPTDCEGIDNLSAILGPVTTKGFGEDQFDLADGIEPGRSVLGFNSSFLSENSFVKKVANSSIATMNSIGRQPAHGQRSRLRDFADSQFLSGTKRQLSSVINTQGSLASTSKMNNLRYFKKASTNTGIGRMNAKARRMEKLSANVMPHLSVSQHYHGDGDWADVASSIAFGEAGFAYLRPDARDAYKFSMQQDYPTVQKQQSEFATISRYGVLRNSIATGESEMVSHQDMLYEQDIYHKLVQFRVFRQFRLWKTFFLWQKTIRRGKFEDRKEKVRKALLLAHPFYHRLLHIAAEHCLGLQGLPVMPLEGVTVYDVSSFAKHQHDATFRYKQQRDEIVNKLIAILCRQGQAFVYSALETTPSAIPMDKYNSLKATQAATNVTITEHIIGPSTTSVLSGLQQQVQRALPQGDRANTKGETSGGSQVTEVVLPEKLTISYTEKAAIRTNCRRLAAVFRLVDFMLRDALFDSIHLGLLKLQGVVEGHSEKERQRRRVKLSTMRAAADEVLSDLREVRQRLAMTAELGTVVDPDSAVASTALTFDGPPEPERAIFRLAVDLVAEIQKPSASGNPDSVNKVQFTAEVGAGGVRHSVFMGDQGSVKNLKRSTMLALQHAEQARQAAALAAQQSLVPAVPKVQYIIAFDLAKDAVTTAFTHAVNNFMRSAAFQEGLLSLDVCATLLRPIVNELKEQPLENRFAQGETAVHALLRSACELLGMDYERALLHARAYSYLCRMYQEHQQLLQQVETAQLAGMAPEVIAGHLEQLKVSQEQCLSVPDEQDVGAYRLDFAGVKAKVTALIQRCRTAFFRTIPEQYVFHGDFFYNELSRILDALQTKHTTVAAFVKLVELFHQTQAEEEKWSTRFQYIAALKDILHAQPGITVSEAVERQNLTIMRVWQRFTLVMSDFESNLDEHCKNYQGHLKQRTKALLDPLDHARAYLHSKLVHEHTSDADLVIAQLSAYLAEVESVLRKGTELEHQQTVLKCHVYNYALMTELASELQSMHVLWSLMKVIKELQISFMAVNFLDADSAEVDRQLRNVEHTLRTRLPSDAKVSAVQVWLADAVAHLQQVAPVIRKLQSSTQKLAHIGVIHAILDRPIYEQDDVTVGELVDVVCILRHAAALDRVYEQSLFEHNLQTTVVTLVRKRNECQFVLETEKDNPSLFFISNFEEISAALEDQLITVQGCLDSHYATPHREEFQVALDDFHLWKRRNEEFGAIQTAYRRIRVLFTCARTSRYLGGSVKFFKIFDEHWRNLMNLAKADPQLLAVYGHAEVQSYLDGAKDAMATVDSDLSRHIHDQCVKFPRLHLIDANYLLEVYATMDPHAAFHKCIALFPFLTDVRFLPDDAHTSDAVISHGEVVTFRKPTSARSSLMDWFRNMESGMNERLDLEIKEHMNGRHLLEDLKMSRTCQQGRLCAVQALFWSQLLKNLEEAPSPVAAMRTQMLAVCEQQASLAALMTAHTTHLDAYHRRSVENLLILLISQRDLLLNQIEQPELGGDPTFSLEVAIKKLWDSDTNTMVVKQGQHKQVYGSRYCGFGERLVVTPLTDRFYLAVQNVVQSGGLCCITGDGLGKHQLTTALATELGYDVVPIDCGAVSSVKALTGIVRAHLGSGFWGNYSHISRMPAAFLGTFLTVMSAVHVALANQEPVLFLAQQRVDIIDRAIARPRFCLFFETLTAPTGECVLPPSVRRQFRIVSYTPPERNVVLSVLLSANNFSDVAATCMRLAALCDYVVEYGLCPDQEFVRFVYRAIPLAKLNYVHVTAPPSTQLGLFTKLLISLLPAPYLDSVSEDDLRYICSLFLEVVYSEAQDGKDFKPPSSLADNANTLYKLIRRKDLVCSVLVTGDAAVGKSTLIREIANNAVVDHNADLEKKLQQLQNAGAGQAAPAVRLPKPMVLYPRILNIFALAAVAPSCVGAAGQMPRLAEQPHSVEGILESLLCSLEPEQTHVIRFDTESSLQVSILLPTATRLATYFCRSVRFVWECPELHQLNPATAMEVPIVPIRATIYDVNDVISYRLKALSSRHGRPFVQFITECVEQYVRPCLEHATERPVLSPCALVENVLALVENICSAHELLVVTGTVKKWESAVRRVVVFACIWSFGAVSAQGREAFQRWFLEHFGAEMKATAQDRIFPTDSDGSPPGSIYEYSLVPVGEKEVYLEWLSFDRTAMAASLDVSSRSAGAYVTTEERLRRSYHDLYYTTVQHAGNDRANMVVPTATGAACHVLQTALMRCGGQLMVAGDAGSGKSMLLRQLFELSKRADGTKLSVDMAARWVCHVTDCPASALMQHIDACRASLTPLLRERRLPEKGFVVIDDLSVAPLPGETTCAEYLRSIYVSGSKDVYHPTEQVWKTMGRHFTLVGARASSPGLVNARLVRHHAVICCDSLELTAVFAVKVQAHSEVIAADVAQDLATVTMGFAQAARKALLEVHHQHIVDRHHPHAVQLQPQDHHFLVLHSLQSDSALADYMLSKVVAGLETMGGYTSNDVVRAWDRTVADHFVRHKAFAELYDTAQDHATNAYTYQYASFTSYLDKERVQRSHGLEALLSTLYSNAPTVEYPLSYKLNASGFFDTKPGIYPGLGCAETVRDILLKKYGPTIVPRGVRSKGLAFWTDVLSVAAELSVANLSGQPSMLLLQGNSSRLHGAVLTTSCAYLRVQYSPLRVDPTAVKTSGPTPSANSQGHLSYREALADGLLEALLLDPTVLRSLKLLRSEIYSSNEEDLPLVSEAALAECAAKASTYHADLMRRVAEAYGTVGAASSFDEDGLAGPDRVRGVTVWHLMLSEAFCRDAGCWSFLFDTMRLRSAYIVNHLLRYGSAVNPLVSAGVRGVIGEFLSRQRFVLSLEDDGWTEEVLHDMATVPGLVSSVRVLPCYEGYDGAEGCLADLIGPELAQTVGTIVTQSAADCQERLRAAHLSNYAEAIACAAYRTGTLLSIATLYERICRHSAPVCAERLRKNVQLFSLTETVGDHDADTLSVDGTKEATSNQEESGAPELHCLGDAVAAVLVARYLAVLLDTIPVNGRELVARVREAGMVVNIGSETNVSTLVLAVTGTVLQLDVPPSPEAAQDNALVVGCLSTAGALPAHSPTRQLLASCALLLACGRHRVVLHDLTCCATLFLSRLLDEHNSRHLRAEHHYTELVLECTADGATELCGDSAPTNLAVQRWKEHSPVVADMAVTTFILSAHSPVLPEVGVLTTGRLQEVRNKLPMLGIMQEVRTIMLQRMVQESSVIFSDGMIVLSCDTLQYAQDWQAVVLRAAKPVSTIAASLQAQCTLPSTRDDALLMSWSEFSNILNALVAHDQTRALPLEALLSVTVVKHLEWLQRVLAEWEYTALLLSVVLNLKLDTASPSGQHMAQRILYSLLSARHQVIGIVPQTEMDEAADDASESSESTAGGGGTQTNSNEKADSEEDEDQAENFRLSDTSVDVLKQTLLAIAQALTSAGGRHGAAKTRRRSSAGLPPPVSTATNASVLSHMRRNTEEWVLWAIDVNDLDMPYKGEYLPNWLDRIAVAANLKPLALVPTVMAGIIDLGLELAAVPMQRDLAAAALRKRDQQLTSAAQVLVVSRSGVKDTLSELEHGGGISTLTDFSLTFTAARQLRGTVRNALRQSIITTATRQSVVLSSAQSQQDGALKAALQMQEQDKRVHFYLGLEGAPASELLALLADETVQAEALDETVSHPARELRHYVVVTRSGETSDHSALQRVVPTSALADELAVVEVPSFGLQTLQSTMAVVTAPRVTMQIYVDFLRYCYHVVASVPIHCPAGVTAIVHRVRWLLVLFHASVQCKLAACGVAEPIGIDTLVQSCVAVDTLLTRAFHNAPKDGFLNPKRHTSRRQSQAQSHPVSANPSRRSSSVHALSIAHAAPLVVLDEKAERRNDLERFDVLAWSLDMLVVEVVDCLYAKLTPSKALQDSIRAIYMCYFTTGSLNPSAEYLYKGKVVLPHDLQRHAADRFFREVREHSQDEASFVELADSTLADANSVSLRAIYRAMEHVTSSFHHHREEHTLSAHDHQHQVALLSSALAVQRMLGQYDAVLRLQRVLRRMLTHLPDAINLNASDIQARMRDHRKNLVKGGGAGGAGGAGGGGGGPTPPAAAPEFSTRRRRAERIAVTFDAREFDPIWAFLLSETHMYNKTIAALRDSVGRLMDSPVQLLAHIAERGVRLSPHTQHTVVARTLCDIEAGLVPSHLTGHHGARGCMVRVDDWCRELADQHHQLLEWLSNGYAGKLRPHLLRNPRGLLYAMKETFCMRSDNTLDKVHLAFRMQEPTNKLQADAFTISKTNFGCSVIFNDLYLHNASFQEKANALEFLPEHSASAHGKKLAVLVSVTKDAHAYNPEEFLCPVYVHSLLPGWPCDLLGLPDCRRAACQSPQATEALLYIPVETTEDVEDCKMYGVAIHSGHRAMLPE